MSLMMFLDAELLVAWIYSKKHTFYLKELVHKPVYLLLLSDVTGQMCHCYFALSRRQNTSDNLYKCKADLFGFHAGHIQ